MSPAAGVAVSPEVATAHTNGGAVIALETTIVCHGMPYPKNLQTAMEVEAIVRETAPSIVQEAGSCPYMPSLSTTSRNPSAKCYGDRFIPDRSAMDMNMSHYLLTETKKDKENARPWRHPLRCSI